jgi:hypothetical protein
MAAGSLRVSWQAEGFAEVGELAVDAVGGALVAAGFAFPAAFFGIVGELPLQAQAFAKSWRGRGLPVLQELFRARNAVRQQPRRLGPRRAGALTSRARGQQDLGHEVEVVESKVRPARAVNPPQRLATVIHQPQIGV